MSMVGKSIRKYNLMTTRTALRAYRLAKAAYRIAGPGQRRRAWRAFVLANAAVLRIRKA